MLLSKLSSIQYLNYHLSIMNYCIEFNNINNLSIQDISKSIMLKFLSFIQSFYIIIVLGLIMRLIQGLLKQNQLKSLLIYMLFYLNCCINALFIIFQQMLQKSVDQKVKECKEVIIQGMQKTIQHKMVYMYLKERKKESDVKQFSVNGKDGIIKMEFNDHEKAKQFYDDANFIQKILIRPFNIYFNLTLVQAEMKKFYLEGISQQNQRKLFQRCRKIGFCKLYTSYSAGPRGKLKQTGVLSFIRKEALSEEEFKSLTEDLKNNLGIKIYNYVHEKGLKCSINMTNFYTDGDINADEIVIQEEGQKRARALLGQAKLAKESNLSIIVKKKQAMADKPARLVVTAIIEFKDVQQTMGEFQKLRDFLVNKQLTKAILFFHNEQNNSFLSLFTMGLQKPAELTEKQFENKLLQDFKKVNVNVIQVNIYKVTFNSSYIGRIYLKTQDEGKFFIADYPTKRFHFYQNYKEGANITFDINVDTKTLRKIKQAQRKAKQTEQKIKKQSQANKRQNRRPANSYPIQGIQGVIPGMPNMPIGISMPGSQSLNMAPPVGHPGMIPPPGIGMPNFPPGMNKPPQNPMMSISIQDQMRNRVKQIIKDKNNFGTMQPETAKRLLIEPLKFTIEDSGISPAQSGIFTNNILSTNDDIAAIIRLLESPLELKTLINSYKH